HNLYDGRKKRWATSVVFSPGRRGDNQPFGIAKARTLLCASEWVKGSPKKGNFDMGMVILDKEIGKMTGWSGLLYGPVVYFKKWEVRVTGYPGDSGSSD